jgi:hypothetical protein
VTVVVRFDGRGGVAMEKMVRVGYLLAAVGEQRVPQDGDVCRRHKEERRKRAWNGSKLRCSKRDKDKYSWVLARCGTGEVEGKRT